MINFSNNDYQKGTQVGGMSKGGDLNDEALVDHSPVSMF